jgi:hypothetical protein
MRSNPVFHRSLAALGGCAAVAAVCAAASAVTITVNGQTVPFNPPPIMQAGRVFVPLRGVFERLGASVVYQGGVINATGNGRAISLKIGSTAATVGGTPRTLDTPPFIVGASTYVPLRFVSEALGAGVNFDAANQLVALTTAAGGPPQGPPPGGPPPVDVLIHHQPPRDASVGSVRPTISADFKQPVDPGSVRISLDGRDVTDAATISTSGFVYAPPSPLQSILHQVQVVGRVSNGPPFSNVFHFRTGTQAPANELILTSPPEGVAVGQAFTVAGHTLPNARVHIVAGATATVGGVFAFGAGSYGGDTIADGNGNFSQSISLQTVPGASIGLTVTSTDPVTKEAAEKKLRLHAQ